MSTDYPVRGEAVLAQGAAQDVAVGALEDEVVPRSAVGAEFGCAYSNGMS